MQYIWHLFDSLPAWAKPVLLTAILGGICSAITVIWKIAMAVYREIRKLIVRYQDERVFRYIKNAKENNSLYGVDEIAFALHRSKRAIWRSLQRLERDEKIKRYEPSRTVPLWQLHDLER